MITVIDTTSRNSAPTPEGTLQQILAPSSDNTRVEVAKCQVEAGKTQHIAPSERTQVAYILEGNGAEITYTKVGKSTVHQANRRSGIYQEPGEEASITAAGTPLVLLKVTVPKHTAKATASNGEAATGYFFEESALQALVDERRIRTRTFWVNKETGLSGS